MESVNIAKSLKNLRFFNEFFGVGGFRGITFHDKSIKLSKNKGKASQRVTFCENIGTLGQKGGPEAPKDGSGRTKKATSGFDPRLTGLILSAAHKPPRAKKGRIM